MASSSGDVGIILRCSDDTLYIGHTTDIVARLQTHNDGLGSRHTAVRRPVSLAYSEQHPSTYSAIARERQLKRWSRSKKDALISGIEML
jgi:putative endonuclease